MSSGRVGKAILLTCFFMAGYGRHRSQWVKVYTLVPYCYSALARSTPKPSQ